MLVVDGVIGGICGLTVAALLLAAVAEQVWRGSFEGSPVALKQFYSIMMQPGAIEELRREAALLSQLRHPNVLRFFGVASHGEDLYIVTEFCPGSLQGWLEVPANSSDLRAVVQVALDVARGMRYLHGRGVVVSAAAVRGGATVVIVQCSLVLTLCGLRGV